MKTVTASEFQNKFGSYKEVAQREPVKVTSNGRDSVVLISIEEFEQYLSWKESRQDSDLVQEGRIDKQFQDDVAGFMKAHSKVLEGLAK